MSDKKNKKIGKKKKFNKKIKIFGEEDVKENSQPKETSSKEDPSNSYMYLKAEFENYKKNALKERSEMLKYSGKNFIANFIDDFLDDFERAIEISQKNENLSDFEKGMELILKKLQDFMKKSNIQSIDPKGEVFDPSFQEALGNQKTNEMPPNHVFFTFKKAYKLHDKIIRFAQVIVSEKESLDSDEKND